MASHGHLMDAAHWRVTGIRELSRLLRAAAALADDGVLCVAEGAWPDGVLRVLRRIGASPGELPHPGPGCASRDAFHVPLTADNARELADLADHAAEPEIGLHFAVFAGGAIVLEWFDAVGDPVSLAPTVPEATVRSFADAAGGRAEWIAHGA